MADKKDLDPNPPLEDRTIAMTQESESEPEFKKQKLEELQRKAYYSVLHASNAETSPISHVKLFSCVLIVKPVIVLVSHVLLVLLLQKKSQIIQRLMEEWKINHLTYVSEESATSSLNSVVGKHIHARLPEEDDLPSNKNMKLYQQAYEDVLNAFTAESPTLSTSRAFIMKDLLEGCNNAHKVLTDDHKIKSDPPLVEPLIKALNTRKIVEPKHRLYPAGCRFCPPDDMMANYFLKYKALGWPMKARIKLEERHDIFSIPPHDFPGYPRQKEWHFYCRKLIGQDPRSLWTRVGEDNTVFDEEGNGVGIKRTYALTEQEEESDDISLPGEIEPPREEWFIEEISLPSSVADTDLVLCHVILNKIEKREEYEEEEEEDDDDDDEEEEEE
ncbi:hypothetical protein N665_0034s0064 [Sinapis alba]|nr:hypothetical protein N665_0034s0064 [Sinapis alba]